MGIVMDILAGALEGIRSMTDVPGLPSTPALATDTALGTKDPTWEEVGTAIKKDIADLFMPGSGTLIEAGAENFGETMENTRGRQDLLDDIGKSKDRDPYQNDSGSDR